MLKFTNVKIPLLVTTTDLMSGNSIIYKSGNLIDAVVQSSSIPGFIEPTLKDERMLVDGGVALPTPVTPLIDNCDFIIAVNITRGVDNQPEPSNIVEITTRSRDVSVSHLNSFLVISLLARRPTLKPTASTAQPQSELGRRRQEYYK